MKLPLWKDANGTHKMSLDLVQHSQHTDMVDYSNLMGCTDMYMLHVIDLVTTNHAFLHVMAVIARWLDPLHGLL